MTKNPTNIVVNLDYEIKLDFHLKNYIQSCLDITEFRKGVFEFSFINDIAMIELNNKYFNKNYSTDVITFNLNNTNDPIADIYICIDEAIRNAKKYEKSLHSEIKLLIVHGLLHIKGYEDYTEQQRDIMFKEQDRVISLIEKIL